jgi:tetratricopeptide (TPR) repeat protein
MLDEWRQRLDDVLAQNRASEVRHLHDWMDIAFGRSGEKRPRPLDLRIHTRLGEIYMKARDYDRAIEQLEQARDLAPRDIFVLRSLGRAYLEKGERDAVQAVLDRIGELDKDAFRHNTECAALAGRFYRTGGDAHKAAEVYRGALGVNPESHYLANLVAEACLEAGNRDGAANAYRQVLDILGRLNESNIWTHASAGNARFFLNDEEGLAREIAAIRQTSPGSDQLAAVERGLETVARHVDGGEVRLRQVLATLRA